MHYVKHFSLHFVEHFLSGSLSFPRTHRTQLAGLMVELYFLNRGIKLAFDHRWMQELWALIFSTVWVRFGFKKPFSSVAHTPFIFIEKMKDLH